MSLQPIHCVIIEDDELARRIIERLIEKTAFLKLEASFDNPVEALVYLRQNEVDLVFLDIEMPSMSGFELIKSLDKKPYIVVMTTNERYAVEAFDHSVSDFLVKPILDYPRFMKAASKALEAKKKPAAPDNFFVKADSLLMNIGVDNLLFIEAFGDYVKVHLTDKVLIVLATLKSLENKLPGDQFTRTHRSYIVNIKKIKSIDSRNIQINDKEIPLAPNHRDELMNKIALL